MAITSPSSSLSSSLSSLSSAVGVHVDLDVDGLWLAGQRPMKGAPGLGKTVDAARLDRAISALLAAGAPALATGTEDPCGPVWKALASAYRKAA